MEIRYYNNIECEIIAELPNDEVAIKFTTGLTYNNDDEYYNYQEPIEQTLVVQKNKLTSKPISKDDIILEREKMLKDANNYKNKQINEANFAIRDEKNKLEKEIKKLNAERNKILESEEIFQTIKKFRNNEFKFAVRVAGNFSIKTIEEFKLLVAGDNEYSENIDINNIQIRLYKNNIVCNSLGSSKKWMLFEDEEKAKEHLFNYAKKLLDSGNYIFNYTQIEDLDKIKFTYPEWNQIKKNCIKRHNSQIQENINGYEKNIEYQKSLLIK